MNQRSKLVAPLFPREFLGSRGRSRSSGTSSGSGTCFAASTSEQTTGQAAQTTQDPAESSWHARSLLTAGQTSSQPSKEIADSTGTALGAACTSCSGFGTCTNDNALNGEKEKKKRQQSSKHANHTSSWGVG
ncbi:hypothetical protein PG996_001792 [Apiospora saccharicola]|uniref:Uncharacterized protein n=1 Tax=Apiospora saccharicola TaxID=335842 RepID=A0ABR1WHL7_9PEZI